MLGVIGIHIFALVSEFMFLNLQFSESGTEILTMECLGEKLDQHSTESCLEDAVYSSNPPDAAISETFENSQEERKLVRKLDRRILPITCLLYLFACSFLCFSLQNNILLTGGPTLILF